MKPKPMHSGVKAALEYGPTIAFVAAYLIFRNETYLIAGTSYTGFVVVIAAFIPIFLLAMGVLWFLTGKLARIQVATAIMLLVFGGLSVWLNDPRLFKMKPTVIYLALALILGVGLLRGQSWLEYIMEDMIPLKPEGWKILTQRVIALFLLSAAANELVWRTQSEEFWVLFETLAMPIVVLGFFLTQIGLFVEYATFKPTKKKKKR
ncbi:septation protein IspZ [uncultured Sulfitobacter sp.]|uniref:inner membrane-spanning protein YciB n=1 Tax=uncultured Sulfitobacter sp. TaxID=191468 RepID=UPI00263A2713|nr:septation protein IspZ [uncultured Sulfitobacter sp.]